jgi:class 3 adenylate cyclase
VNGGYGPVIDEWQAAGLYDPEAPDAEERRALLEYLATLGMSVDDVGEAACGRQLGQVAADHVLWGDAERNLTLADVAAKAGMDEETARRISVAGGLAVEDGVPMFRKEHAHVLQGVSAAATIFGEEAILQFARVAGAAAARVAEAAVAIFFTNVSPRLQAGGASELDDVRESAEAVRAFGLVPEAMDTLLREHFIAAIRRMGLLDIAAGGTTAVAIAFIDLSGSTRLTHRLSPPDLVAALSAFEHAAMDAAVARDCRVVKLIGDEVMIAGPSPTLLIEIVDDVFRVIDEHPALDGGRAGVAAGDAVSRDGDYFGPVVTLAARLVAAAEVGEVLADEAVARVAAEHGHAVGPPVEYALKGFDAPVRAHRLTR